LKTAGAGAGLLLAVGVIAPFLHADGFGKNISGSLERALGRRVEIGAVHFNVFRGPGFSVERVVIHEDPKIGIEPIARVDTLEVTPRIWPLLRGHLVAASIRLEDASINLAKTGPPGEPGRWNFEGFLNRNVISAFPGIHVRNGRINFKFGDTKSVFYLTNADVDITPPSSGDRWSVECSAEPARTDRPARGLGAFTVEGNWIAAAAGDRLNLDLRLERTGLGEITALLRGQNAGVHGTVSSRVHLEGPLKDVRINGRLTVEDVHRWDLLPPKGTEWPLDVRGRLDLLSQHLELESNSAGNVPLPLFARFRVSNYLSQPRWGVSVNWNQFPVEPLMELARHMGAQFPPRLKLTGTIDGAIGYSGAGSFQGQMAFHETVLTVPDSPPVRFGQAAVLFGNGHVYLKPALVRVTDQDQVEFTADYAMGAETLDLNLSTEGMNVASLRSQVALAAVPWLEQVRSGEWSGQLHYRRAPGAEPGWTGKLVLENAVVPVPGMTDPVELESARAQIDHARVVVDRISARVHQTPFSGEYRYEPETARPHRIRLQVEELDAEELERQMLPALRRSGGLIARALGRAAIPDWLRTRNVEGTLQVGVLQLGGERIENLRGQLVWDVARAELGSIRAHVAKGTLTGKLAVNLRGGRPLYVFTGKVKGMNWQDGKVDAEGKVEAGGIGAQLLASLTSEGTFTASDLEFGGTPSWNTVSGAYQLAWGKLNPRLRFTDLQLSSDDETYTGRGATQDDGRLLVVLTNGTREMRMSGTLAKLKLDEALRQ
jgi:hypothetical protein